MPDPAWRRPHDDVSRASRYSVSTRRHSGRRLGLELVLANEVDRRDRISAGLRARSAHLDPTMVLDARDNAAAVSPRPSRPDRGG